MGTLMLSCKCRTGGGCCLASKSYAGTLGGTNTAIHGTDSLANTNAVSQLAARHLCHWMICLSHV